MMHYSNFETMNTRNSMINIAPIFAHLFNSRTKGHNSIDRSAVLLYHYPIKSERSVRGSYDQCSDDV